MIAIFLNMLLIFTSVASHNYDYNHNFSHNYDFNHNFFPSNCNGFTESVWKICCYGVIVDKPRLHKNFWIAIFI